MKSHIKKFLAGYLIAVCFSIFAYGQTDKSNEPVLAPLTETEKNINPKNIIINQPDFTAVETYFSARSVSGFSAVRKVARKGSKYLEDTGVVIVITELDKPVLRLNSDKTFQRNEGVYRPFINPTSPLNPTDLLGFEDISFNALGTIEVDGHKLLKIQAKSKEFGEEVFLYADLSRKKLITIIQILSPRRSSIQRLQEVSFEVPDALFDISGYRELPKHKWNKIKTAKVYYEGKLVDKALVFRHENYVFIHVAQFEHFFVDLDKNVADTVVFQGLLVSKDGAYIWRTNDDEAVSIGELYDLTPNCKNCVKVKTESNLLIIPDLDNTSRTLVKVIW